MTTATSTPPARAPIARTAVLLAALIGALTWNVLQVDDRSDDGALTAPPLRSPEPRCELASPDREELLARSARLTRAAHARIERYPFRPAEGLPSLALLVEASACTREAGADGDAASLTAEAQRFHRRLAADYRDRLLRVERALVDGQARRARADIDVLAAQLEGEGDPFAQRMRNLRASLADGEHR